MSTQQQKDSQTESQRLDNIEQRLEKVEKLVGKTRTLVGVAIVAYFAGAVLTKRTPPKYLIVESRGSES
jgi:hypothetical protein